MIKVEVNEINKENCLCSLTIHESGDNEIWLTNEFTHTDYTITLVNIPFDMGYTSSVYG
ncbi:MAG: hypothetical protein MJ233_03590 [Mycoplasmoidaceae bacterium]|nr:hypothetical protein [Mycoplasmoidaceae bacterium]